MTTPPGQDPRPGPTRGGPARPAPRGADSAWPGGNPDGRGTGLGRGSAGSGQDGVDGRRGGNAAGTSGRSPGPRGSRGVPGAQGTPPADGRGGPGRDWATRSDRGPRTRGPREPVPGGGDNDRARGTRRGYTAADGEPADRVEVRRIPALRWMGTLPTRGALFILIGAALIGVAGTILTGSEPGFLLGLLIVAGSVVAALGIRRHSVYLLIPLPALAFFVAAVATGAVHDSGLDSSGTALGVNFLQWIADVFFGMCAATILVVVISAGRWLLSRQLVS